jgi:putative glutamine amidotransferase
MKLHIGISFVKKNDPHYGNYRNAILHAAKELGYEVQVTDLSDHPEMISDIDGIVFTGGADVDPVRYGKPELRALCKNIEDDRDAIEFEFADKADELGLPILGICRGLQLLNVHYGGTLIADLETSGKPSHSRIGVEDRRHEVHIEAGTLLKKITGVFDGEVTSAHHQAIDQLGPGLEISAKSFSDDVIEAIEWSDKSKRPYFMAIQWHPERMNFDERLAGLLFENFLANVAAQKMLAARIKE